MLRRTKARVVSLMLLCLLSTQVWTVTIQVSGVSDEVAKNIKSRLQEVLRSTPPSNESDEALQNEIQAAMYPYGFFNPRIRIANRQGNKALTLHIQPGPKLRIHAVTVQITGPGATNAEILATRARLRIRSGDPFTNANYEKAKDDLLSAADRQGYLRASFKQAEVLIDKVRNSATVTLVFDTGPQYYFGQVRFDPTYLSPDLLRRYIPFKEGESYSADQVLAFESNLSASGYFSAVIVKPGIDTAKDVPIDVHLKRAKRFTYSLGAGYGTDTGVRGRAALHVAPVNRQGHKFNAVLQGSQQENALLAQYVIPGQNPVNDSYTVTGSASNLNYDSGYSNALQLSAAYQHITSSHQRIFSLNALTERYDYTGLPKTTKSVLYPKAALIWRKVTDPLFSPSGYNINLNGFVASKAIVSSNSMAQVMFDAKAAYTLDPIRTRFYLHTIQGLTGISNIDNLPLSLAMLLGGTENMRGYAYNAIGPGKILNYGGIELQKETFDKWYVLGYFDTGNVYKPSAKEVLYDVGAGLMWVSPIGPIKVSIAVPTNNHLHPLAHHNPQLVINMGPDI